MKSEKIIRFKEQLVHYNVTFTLYLVSNSNLNYRKHFCFLSENVCYKFWNKLVLKNLCIVKKHSRVLCDYPSKQPYFIVVINFPFTDEETVPERFNDFPTLFFL